jgi:hypothetical protein
LRVAAAFASNPGFVVAAVGVVVDVVFVSIEAKMTACVVMLGFGQRLLGLERAVRKSQQGTY